LSVWSHHLWNVSIKTLNSLENSNTEAHNLKAFLLCTYSVAGALPCGLLITTDGKESSLKQGFTMLKNCLPDYA
jgi:hypothetical protein